MTARPQRLPPMGSDRWAAGAAYTAANQVAKNSTKIGASDCALTACV
jgi:hypothetical protein